MKMKKKINSSAVKKIFQDVSEDEVVDLTMVEPEGGDFADAATSLTQDEVEAALETIAGIADAVLEADGKETDDLDYQEVLEIVDEVTQEPEETPEEEIDAIESSVINLTLAQDGEPEELTICTGEDDEIDTVVGADDPAELISPAPIDVEPDAEIAIAANRKVDLTQAKTYKVAINSHWKDIDAVHAKAWDMAEEKTKAAGKTPEMGSKYYGMVMALAKTYYNRLTRGEVWEEAAELGSAKIRAVLSALKKIFSDEKKEYWLGEINEDGSVSIYEHDDYVSKFGEEPEGEPILASTKRGAFLLAQKANPKVKILSSEDIDGATPPTPDKTPATDGDAAGIEDEGLLADGPQLHTDDIDGSSKDHQDTDPLESPADFNAQRIEEIILPDEAGDKQALQFVEAAKDVLVLKSGKMNSYDHLHGRVRPLNNNKGILFLKSNIFGLVAVRGTFQRGIKNSRYSAFCKTKAGYVDSVGNIYQSKATTQYLLASAISNKATKKATPVGDIVSALERQYVDFLKSNTASTSDKSKEYYKLVAQRRAAFARKVLSQNLSLTSSIHTLSKKIASSAQSVDVIKQQMAEQAYLADLKARDAAINSSKKATNAQSNINYLADIM